MTYSALYKMDNTQLKVTKECDNDVKLNPQSTSSFSVTVCGAVMQLVSLFPQHRIMPEMRFWMFSGNYIS